MRSSSCTGCGRCTHRRSRTPSLALRTSRRKDQTPLGEPPFGGAAEGGRGGCGPSKAAILAWSQVGSQTWSRQSCPEKPVAHVQVAGAVQLPPLQQPKAQPSSSTAGQSGRAQSEKPSLWTQPGSQEQVSVSTQSPCAHAIKHTYTTQPRGATDESFGRGTRGIGGSKWEGAESVLRGREGARKCSHGVVRVEVDEVLELPARRLTQRRHRCHRRLARVEC